MGKSSKKSTPKVDVAPAVVPPSKSTKKGKREPEETVEKQVVAKKQKRDVGVEQAVQKQKNETKTKKTQKTQKKKEQSSSSEESSDSEEEQKVQVAKKGVLANPPAKESSSEESSSDEETTVKAVAPPKKLAAAAKNGTAKKGKQDSSSDSSDSDSDEDEEPKSKVTAPSNKLPAPAVKNGLSSAPKKKAESSDDSDSDSSSDEDDEEMAKVISKKLLTAAAKNVESSDDSDSDGTDSDEEDPKVSSDAGKPSAKTVQEETSSDEEDSDESSDNDSTKKQSVKKDTDVEMVDAVSPKANTNQADSKSEKKAPKTPATPQSSGSKTLFVGNLSYQVEKEDVENFFNEAGEVVDVRFASDADGRFRGFGHVEFATAEAAQNALKMNGKELNGRGVRLDLAHEKGSYTPSGKETNSFQKGGRGQSQTLFVKGFDKAGGEDEIRSSLEEHFGTCGEISRVSIPKDFETGGSKGIAYIDFADGDSFNKALELNGTELGGYYLTVDEAKPRGDSRDSGGRGRGGRSGGRDGGRFGGRRGGGRGGSGGRFGSGGRGRGGPNRPSMAAAGTGRKTSFDYE